MWPFKKAPEFDSKAFADLADTLRTLGQRLDACESRGRTLDLEQADLSDRLKRALGRWSQEKRRQPEPETNSEEAPVVDVNELIRQGLYRG